MEGDRKQVPTMSVKQERSATEESSMAVKKDSCSVGCCAKVLTSKATLLLFLCCFAVSLSLVAYYHLSRSETTQAQDHFNLIAERALLLSQKYVGSKKAEGEAMSAVLGSAAPENTSWPLVTLPG
ncbi:hypothetical protein B484DRAFT_231964 [Ochromonadaceae sp. CCMP2298]|nr:hypothetical protein B484DRAFT_231964 [Ochromonadaceae sp. CCMP2298]